MVSDLCARRDVLRLVQEVVSTTFLESALLSVDRLGTDVVLLMEHVRVRDPWLHHILETDWAPGWWCRLAAPPR